MGLAAVGSPPLRPAIAPRPATLSAHRVAAVVTRVHHPILAEADRVNIELHDGCIVITHHPHVVGKVGGGVSCVAIGRVLDAEPGLGHASPGVATE